MESGMAPAAFQVFTYHSAAGPDFCIGPVQCPSYSFRLSPNSPNQMPISTIFILYISLCQIRLRGWNVNDIFACDNLSARFTSTLSSVFNVTHLISVWMKTRYMVSCLLCWDCSNPAKKERNVMSKTSNDSIQFNNGHLWKSANGRSHRYSMWDCSKLTACYH